MATNHTRIQSCFLMVLAGFFLTSGTLFSQDKGRAGSASNKILLNENEIRVTNSVAFENYQSTNMVRNPEDLIIAIGSRLTRAMLSNGRGGNRKEYFFYRVLPDDKKFGADLFSLGEASEINHVVNLNRILQGYLQETYGFQKTRAEAVATFILVYNAVNRNKRELLAEKYSDLVSTAVPEGKLGIDLSYRNWPGKTTIVIPTSPGNIPAGELGQSATSQLAKDPANRKVREEFVKVREEQVVKDEGSLSNRQRQLNEEREALKKKESVLKEREAKAATPEEKQKVSEDNKKLNEDKARLKDKEAETEKAAVKVAEEKASINQEKSKLEETKPVVVAGDPTSAVSQGEVFFLKTLGVRGANFIQQLLIINPKNDTVRVAPLDGISGSHFNFLEGDPLLIMTDPSGKASDLFLARVDRQSLKIKNISKEAVFHSSKIWLHEGAVYVIGMGSSQSYLLKLGPDLAVLAKSDTVIFPDTQMTFAEGKVYATVLQGNQNSHVIVFSQKDLKKITVIR